MNERLNWLILAMVVLAMLMTTIDVFGCVGNHFFKIDIPPKWEEKCKHGKEIHSQAPAFINHFAPSDPSMRYQWGDALVIQKEVDLKEFIKIYISEFEETKLFENLCYYKEEYFHGVKALSYTFGGECDNVRCVGKVYAFHAEGYTFLFISKYLPNKSGKREEIDIWETLKWYPKGNWKFD